jgi:predicted RNA-binding protein with TRAM domain
MHDPIVHRLHLDKAGKSIQGAVTATGFTVVIPGVKVMESPKAIMDRDSRIAHVKTKNGTSGAEINFQFKDGIPGYRVRLKKDYVEFLISSPSKGGGAEKQASSTGGKSHAKKHHKKSAQAATDNGAKKQSAGKKHAVKGGKKKGKK